MLNVIGFADFVLHVGDQRVFHLADTAIFHLGVTPGVVGELGIDGNTDHFHTALLELFIAVIEGNQLGRTDEGEIEGIEEQDGCFAFDVGRQVEGVNNLAIAQNGSSGEIRCGTAYQYHIQFLIM